jgi:hypothetical protein
MAVAVSGQIDDEMGLGHVRSPADRKPSFAVTRKKKPRREAGAFQFDDAGFCYSQNLQGGKSRL